MRDPLVLIRALRQESGREEAAASLIELGAEAVPLLCRSLSNRDEEVREVAARILGEIGDPEAASSLGEILVDSEEDVREAAAQALGKIGAVSQVGKLCRLLADRERKVGVAAAVALGRIGDPRAVQALCRALRHDNHLEVAGASAEALVAIGDPRAVKPLCRLLAARQKPVRRMAAGVLEGLAERTCAPELEIALRPLDWLALRSPARVRGDGVYARAAAAIRAATVDSANLPRPSAAPRPDSTNLPFPSSPAASGDPSPTLRRPWWTALWAWITRK